MRLGILGGTFDPIHHGHLFIAQEAAAANRLDRVLFIPNGSPPHRKAHPEASAADRLEMVKLATQPNPLFGCSEMEIARQGPSYAVDTLAHLKHEHGDTQLFFITGADAIAEILSWREHERLWELATFVAALRPGYSRDDLERRLPPRYMKRIQVLETTALNISATEVRQRVRSGLPIRYLTPDAVAAYIACHAIYAGRSSMSHGGAPAQ